MPPPSRPPLAVACYYNRVDEVKRLLASGADPLEESYIDANDGSPLFTLPQQRSMFQCVHFGYAECVKALLTAQPELVDSGATLDKEPDKMSPLLYLLSHMASPPNHQLERPGSDPIRCIRLLLDAGASLEPVVLKIMGGTLTNDAFRYARMSGNGALVRMLGDAARLRYSPKTHRRFPRLARYAAAEGLRLGYQIDSGVLSPVWAEHVRPFLVSRTSRGAVPSLSPASLFINTLSVSELKKIVARGEAAALELRRGD